MQRITHLLDSLKSLYADALAQNLVGLYVHGSLAFGCFEWARSDVDFIAVAKRPLTNEAKLYLLDALVSLLPESPPKGLEMSVVLECACRPFVYPTPYELHFSNGWLDRWQANPLALCDTEGRTDRDLAAHFTVIRAVGLALCGAPIATVFSPVPRADYLDSILLDVGSACEDVRHNYAYVVLNLCRALAYLKTGDVLSKQSGGHWALEALPRWQDVVRPALSWYAGEPLNAPDEKESAAFCEDMLSRLEAARALR